MKKFIICLAITGMAGSALALDRPQLNDRIQSLTAQFETLQNSSHAVPANDLNRAKGIVLLNSTKGGLIFAYRSGHGVAMIRQTDGKWSAPAFVNTSGASLGFQAGGEEDFYAVLLMTKDAADKLTQSNVNFAAGVGGTAGNENASANATTIPADSIMVYSLHHGLFGGAAFKGGSISPDNTANDLYYGKTVSMDQILMTQAVKPSKTEDHLIAQVSR